MGLGTKPRLGCSLAWRMPDLNSPYSSFWGDEKGAAHREALERAIVEFVPRGDAQINGTPIRLSRIDSLQRHCASSLRHNA